MSKFLGLREEHMDLFGTLSNGTYTSGLSFTSGTGEVKGNVIQEMADQIAHWKAKLMVVKGAPSGVTLTLKIYASNKLNAGALDTPVTLVTVEGLPATLDTPLEGKMIYDNVIPNGYKFYQVSLTPSATATGCKVEGWIEPEFN